MDESVSKIQGALIRVLEGLRDGMAIKRRQLGRIIQCVTVGVDSTAVFQYLFEPVQILLDLFLGCAFEHPPADCQKTQPEFNPGGKLGAPVYRLIDKAVFTLSVDLEPNLNQPRPFLASKTEPFVTL